MPSAFTKTLAYRVLAESEMPGAHGTLGLTSRKRGHSPNGFTMCQSRMPGFVLVSAAGKVVRSPRRTPCAVGILLAVRQLHHELYYRHYSGWRYPPGPCNRLCKSSGVASGSCSLIVRRICDTGHSHGFKAKAEYPQSDQGCLGSASLRPMLRGSATEDMCGQHVDALKPKQPWHSTPSIP